MTATTQSVAASPGAFSRSPGTRSDKDPAIHSRLTGNDEDARSAVENGTSWRVQKARA